MHLMRVFYVSHSFPNKQTLRLLGVSIVPNAKSLKAKLFRNCFLRCVCRTALFCPVSRPIVGRGRAPYPLGPTISRGGTGRLDLETYSSLDPH